MIKLIGLQIIFLVFFSYSAQASEPIVLGDEAAVVSAPQSVTLSADQTISTISKASLDESEIPLHIDLTKKTAETTSTSSRLFLTFFILLSIIGVSYYLVRKYKLSNHINKSNKQIKIISQHYLGPKKSLAIIHVAGESMLIGITDSNISMIKSLSLIDDEVPVEVPKSFATTLDSKNQPPAGATARETNFEELDEEFSFSGIKDTVSKKIKSMRRF